MSILSELNDLLAAFGVAFETGTYSGTVKDEYIVIVPLADQFEVFADNQPQSEIQEARLSLYCKGNYIKLRNRLTKVLLESDFTISDRRYIGFENETKYHHYAVEVEKNYECDYECEKEE